MALSWQNVYIFISSTFSDMHAERDYLVKRVFPELQDWCEQRRLRLMDVDLRWGVTEADATANANVIRTCLNRIDDCRPFFICLLGQRYGWIPQREDISPETFADYPVLEEAVAEGVSVTELEILHAARRPFRGRQASGRYDPAEHSFFYLRDDNYLKDLPEEPALLKSLYTDETIVDPAVRKLLLKKQHRLRSEIIPGTGRPTRHYQASWDLRGNTPEIALPLKCPALLEPNVRRWQETWEQALGLNDRLTGREIPAVLRAGAEDFNKRLTAGRLGQFSLGQQPLHEVILADLKSAIAERYPEHMEIAEASDLQRELNQHEEFLFANSKGFIERQEDFRELNDYLTSDCRRLFVLTGEGGMGKSMLLAAWIERCKREAERFKDTTFHFRFIGQSDGSTTVSGLLHYLLRELKEVADKIPETATEIRVGPDGETYRAEVPLTIPADPQKLRVFWRKQLDCLGNSGRTVIVIDALDQLESGLKDLSWLPMAGLPEKVKMVLSFRTDSPEARSLKELVGDNRHILLSEVAPFSTREDRRRLVEAYLSQYLKELDAEQVELLIDARGAKNPLFLRVVLSELKVFGSYEQLQDKIQSDFGQSPVSAFEAVLKRLETDPVYSSVRPLAGIPLLFGLLLHARHGLSVEELSSLLLENLELDTDRSGPIEEAIHMFLRQVKPFLGRREGRYGFFYDSFREAAHKRYVLEKPDHPPAAWHSLLADYFAARTLYLDGAEEKGPDRRKLAELPFQQARAHRFADLQTTLTDYEFLKAKVNTVGPQPLIEDYREAEKNDIWSPSLKSVGEALQLSAHVLEEDSAQLASQLSGRLIDTAFNPVKTLLAKGRKLERSWFRPLNLSLINPGGPLLKTLIGHRSPVIGVGFTTDNKQILSIGSNGTFIAWELKSGNTAQVLSDPDYAKQEWEQALPKGALLEDPKKKKSIRIDYDKIEVTDITLKPNVLILAGHNRRVTSHAFSSDGKLLVTGGEDHTLRVWRMAAGEVVANRTHTDRVTTVAVAKNYRWGASGGADGSLFLWELQDKAEPVKLTGHTGCVNSVVFTPDSQRVISASSDRTIRVWDLKTGAEDLKLLGHEGPVTALMVMPDGRRALSASLDKTLKLWDLFEGSARLTLRGPDSINPAVAGSPNGRLVAAGYRDRVIRIWDLDNGKRVSTCIGHINTINTIAFSPDGRLIVSGGNDQTVRIWETVTGKPFSILSGHWDSVCNVSFPEQDRVISLSLDDTIRIWDLTKDKEIQRYGGRKVESGTLSLPPAAYRTGVYSFEPKSCLTFPDEDKMLSFFVNDDTLRLWDHKSSHLITAFTGDQVLTCCAASDKTHVIAGTLGGRVHLLRFE